MANHSGPPTVSLGTMLTGTVKAWIEDRGMGFIHPDDGGDDAFVHRCDLVDGVCLMVGYPVIFEDAWDYSKNKRVAKKVSGAVSAEAKGASKGTSSTVPSGVPTATIGQMLTGIVKTWKDERGMGFIQPATGGDDAFVHRSSLLDGQWLVVGSPVMFEDSWDQMKGKRIAKNVTGAVAAEGKGAEMVVYTTGGKGQAVASSMGVTRGMDTLQAPQSIQVLPNVQAFPGMQAGVVKAWYEDRGMGFIKPDAGGDDVFVHRSGLMDAQSLSIGIRVMFEDGWDAAKGKRMARSLPAAYHPAEGPGGPGTADLRRVSMARSYPDLSL